MSAAKRIYVRLARKFEGTGRGLPLSKQRAETFKVCPEVRGKPGAH